MIYIYSLSDPRTGRVRYIGKTVNVRKRHREHLHDKTQTHRGKWIRSLLAANIVPVMRVLFTADLEDGSWFESAVISRMRKAGEKLTNCTDGGQGTTGFIPSVETRQKMSLAKIGKKLSPDHCENLSAAHMGKPKSAEHAKNISLGKLRAMNDETRRRIGNGHKGLRMPREIVERIRQQNLGRRQPPEERAMRSRLAFARRFRHSDEARLRISEARRNYWRKRKEGTEHINPTPATTM